MRKGDSSDLHDVTFDKRGDKVEAEDIYREGVVSRLRAGLDEGRTHEMVRTLARLRLEQAGIPLRNGFTTHTKPTGVPATDLGFAQVWTRASTTLTASEPDDELIQQFFQKQAVLLLKAAVAGGLRNPASLRTNADFEPLRGRTDFQELLAEIEKKSTN